MTLLYEKKALPSIHIKQNWLWKLKSRRYRSVEILNTFFSSADKNLKIPEFKGHFCCETITFNIESNNKILGAP